MSAHLVRVCLLWLSIFAVIFALPQSKEEESSPQIPNGQDFDHADAIGNFNYFTPDSDRNPAEIEHQDDKSAVARPEIKDGNDIDNNNDSGSNGDAMAINAGPELNTVAAEIEPKAMQTLSEQTGTEPTATEQTVSEQTATERIQITESSSLINPTPVASETVGQQAPETTNSKTELQSNGTTNKPEPSSPPFDIGDSIIGNYSIGLKFKVGGQPYPKTDEEREALKVLNFFANMQYELFNTPCNIFSDPEYENIGLLENYKRDVICLSATQSKAHAYAIERAMMAGGMQPMPICGRHAYEFPYQNPLDMVRYASWFTGLGISLYLGMVQTSANNSELATFAASMATDEARKSVLLYVDQPDNHANPFQVPFDTPIEHKMAYQMLLKFAPACRADLDIEILPELWYETDFTMPPEPPKKHPPLVYQFYWDMSRMKAPSPDERTLYMAWLSESTNVTLTAIRRCGTDPATKLGCGRTNLGKGIRGTAIAVVVDSGDVGEGWTREDFLSHAITGPTRVIVT